MLLKIYFVLSLACVTFASNTVDSEVAESSNSDGVKFETSHKNPEALSKDAFQTAHKIPPYLSAFTGDSKSDFGGLRFLRSTMNFSPTKERPELNPILSALINEDVRKSIEAKRAIEKEELEAVRAEIDAAVARAERKEKLERKNFAADKSDVNVEELQTSNAVLTTMAPVKKPDLEDDINVGFVDQTISLDTAGTENNKKSRIEIKKGPNGQEYEYEYVYYYEDEDENKPADAAVAETEDSNLRGKSRYSTIDRSTAATPTENSLVSGKAKGRSSNVAAEDIEVERLPAITRFPSRGKNINEVPPTPALDVQQGGAVAVEKKRISVKRPSLELVDSETFNTDEKQVKGSPRNGDTEANKPALELEQEAAAAAAAAAATAAAKSAAENIAKEESGVTAKSNAELGESEYGVTTPPMEKAALDLYAILTNEKFMNDMTTNANSADYATTNLPDTTNVGDDEDTMTTLIQSLPSSTTTTTTTTTTEAPTTTTTTTTTAKPSLFGRRPGQSSGGRNRYKPKNNNGGSTDLSTTTTTETPSEQPKTGKNRYSRPSVGGRSRLGARTTHAPAPASTQEEEEEKIEVKEVKPVSSGFGRSRPRNRFNLRGSTTTEKHEDAAAANGAGEEETVSSTTTRATRSRPTLNLRGRSRGTSTKAPVTATDDEAVKNNENEAEPKPAAATGAANKPSRFSLNRPGQNRLLPRNKFGRTTETPVTDDSAADSSHHNDIKGGNEQQQQGDDAEKSENKDEASTPVSSGLNRLKSRPRLNIQKTEKQKAAAAPVAPRKINPLLAKRRLQLGSSTTEAALAEDNETLAGSEENDAKVSTNSTAEDNDSAKDETTEETETTTKQARGLGLLGQRRRLPLRKPGTIL